MYRLRQLISLSLVIALIGLGLTSAQAQRRPYRMSDQQLERIIRRIETNSDRFRDSVDRALDRSRLDGTRQEDSINDYIRDFTKATDQLRDRFNDRNSAAGDVENVLERASMIDNFMQTHRMSARAQADWTTLKSDLNTLANAYNVAWNWNTRGTNQNTAGNYGAGRDRDFDIQLTGTYRLDQSRRSDDGREALDRATRDLPASERQRIYDQMRARLEAPEMIAIERRGRTVTIASSRAPQINFEVDGRERTEQLPNGRTARVSARFEGDQLVVSSSGNRDSDFTVTFDPTDNGRRMQVTRRIYSDRFNQPVIVQNTYERTSDVAQWNIYDSSRVPPAYNESAGGGDFIVRSGETLVAVLNNDLSTKGSNDGDRFTLTVKSPSQYEGAIIEGRISNVSRSGRATGRSGMTFNFDRIRTRDGRSYQFAGFVENVRTMSGETVRVDNEGSVQDKDSQTERTVQRAAIGTAVGAIIGAIAGGGKGAAIGAVIGGAGGAGSVYVQGRDDLELMRGAEVTIRASGPNR